MRDEVYRIGREAIVNAFLHSHGTKIEVEIEYASRSFTMSIRDDGCGIVQPLRFSIREGHALTCVRVGKEAGDDCGELAAHDFLVSGVLTRLSAGGRSAFPACRIHPHDDAIFDNYNRVCYRLVRDKQPIGCDHGSHL